MDLRNILLITFRLKTPCLTIIRLIVFCVKRLQNVETTTSSYHVSCAHFKMRLVGCFLNGYE